MKRNHTKNRVKYFEIFPISRFNCKHRSLLLIGCCVMICDFVTAPGSADDSSSRGIRGILN